MKKIIILLFSTLLFLANGAIAANKPYAEIPITIMGQAPLSNNPYFLPNLERMLQQGFEQEHIDISNSGPYAKAQVQFLHNKNQKGYLLIYLLNKFFFSVDIVKINLDQYDQFVFPFIKNYQLTAEDNQQQPTLTKDQLKCPDPTIDFIIATTFYEEEPNVKSATDHLFTLVEQQGYHSYKLLGKEATVANYENWLSCPNLKGFAHTGHGKPSFIILSDGVLTDQNIIDSQFNLNATIVTFTSCQVFNHPLKEALIDSSHAQKFSGGITNLPIFGGAEAYECAWEAALNGQNFTDSLGPCTVNNDPLVKNSKADLHIINSSTLPLVIVTSSRTIELDGGSYSSSGQLQASLTTIDMQPTESLVSVYFVRTPPLPNLICEVLDKQPGLKAKEYEFVSIVSAEGDLDHCWVIDYAYDGTGSVKNPPVEYGVGGHGSDYLRKP